MEGLDIEKVEWGGLFGFCVLFGFLGFGVILVVCGFIVWLGLLFGGWVVLMFQLLQCGEVGQQDYFVLGLQGVVVQYQQLFGYVFLGMGCDEQEQVFEYGYQVQC